jgi:hypothetical protein
MASQDAERHLADHGKTIDELHHKLAAISGANKEKLKGAVDKLKHSYAQFTEDAKECMQ